MWKIQLTIGIKFVSSKDNHEKPVQKMITKKSWLMTQQIVIKKIFILLLNRYQNNLKKSMKDGDFVYD